MMEQQVEKVRAETKAVRESMGRAREVIEGIGKGEASEGQTNSAVSLDARGGEKRRRRREGGDKRVWEVLEREVGRL